MICRLWRGWTAPENADEYERIVRPEVIPKIEARKIPGFRHVDLMRRATRRVICEPAPVSGQEIAARVSRRNPYAAR